MTAKHGRSARPSPRDDGPPTDQLPPSGPARRRRVGARSAARRPLSVWLSGLSRRTVVIVAAVAVVLLAVAVVGYLVATSPEEVGTTEATGHQLTYRATSSDNTVVVTYSKGNNNLDGQAKATSPWSAAVTVTGSIAVLTVTSGSSDRVNSVSCTIEDANTGQTLAHKEVSPSTDATATCVTGNLGP